MAEAARLLALRCIISDDFKRKTSKEKKKFRRERNLRSKRHRARWRDTRVPFPKPPDDEASRTINALKTAASKIDESGDWDCWIAAASLWEDAATLTLELGARDEAAPGNTAMDHRKRAADIWASIVSSSEMVELV